MRVLITGGAGRLGTTICRAFYNDGIDVCVFDLDTPPNRRRVRDLDGAAKVFWGDITDANSVRRALDGIDAVVHMAAVLPPVADAQPELARKVNVEGTRILVDLLREKGGNIPFVFTSSAAAFGPTPDACGPLSPDVDQCRPSGTYGETKLEAEDLIRESGIDHVVLRLSATMYFIFELSDIKRMFTLPLDQRVEYCHPDDTARAILNSVKRFEKVKGNTFVISGGPGQRMVYKDMVGAILGVMGLPLPPAGKFVREAYYLDWYDTARSQELLEYQKRNFSDYLQDFASEVSRRYGSHFLPFMRRFAGPVFGALVVRFF